MHPLGIHWDPTRRRLTRHSRNGTTILRPWPDPRAWFRPHNGTWRGHIPVVEVNPERFAGLPRAREAPAWATVPGDVRAAILQSPFRHAQWARLNFAARVPGALPLLRDAPVLAGCATQVNALRQRQQRPPLTHPWRALRRHVPRARGRGGQLQLLAWLGLPPERAFLRTLRRLHDLGSIVEVAELGRAWACPLVRKRLLHLPRLSVRRAFVLVHAARDPALLRRIDFGLLETLGDGEAFGHDTPSAEVVRVVARLVELRANGGRVVPVPPLRTVEDVLGFHRTTLMLSHWDLARDREAFPEPPLAGDANVQPLPSWDALVDEGTLQENCLKDVRWAMEANARLGYGYAVRAPTADGGFASGTAWIRPDPDTPWRFRLVMVEGPANEPADPAVTAAAERWFEARTAQGAGGVAASWIDAWPGAEVPF
jgi:hypothetical protein